MRKNGLKQKILTAIALLLLTTGIAIVLSPKPEAARVSTYALNAQLPFNRHENYPAKQAIDPTLYRPVGGWVGRLILPSRQQMQQGTPSDWVWMEVYTAPAAHRELIGKIIRLQWSNTPQVKAYVQAVTRDVKFVPATEASQRRGNIVPERLDRLSQVGPLRSLAGARPEDNAIVTLVSGAVIASSESPLTLQIQQEPVQITGRYYGLVKILTPDRDRCTPIATCQTEYFRVRHYNPKSKQFDGIEETIHIPQQPVDRDGIWQSTPQQLESSPAGEAGWYIYGTKDAEGIFVVQALKPRSLFQLQPERSILGKFASLDYINAQNWQDTENRKGTLQTVLLDPTSKSPSNPISTNWHEGALFLVIHLFGGIGGNKAESTTLATVTGHFAYGIAQIVRDPFTQELQFDLKYQQIYVHNPHGIIAGTTSWENYMGDLQRGWMGTRPVADAIVDLPAITQDYNFDGIKLSPLTELQQQLQVMMARYRTGDGTGSAGVTPATSCVQDSNQALYIAIAQIKQLVASNPAIRIWLKTHPQDPQTLRFQQLIALGQELDATLVPLGIVRSDWQQNATTLAGIGNSTTWQVNDSLLSALTAWRTMIPRGTHDELARILLSQGARLWYLRTNQIGGWDANIAPLAPTVFLGQITLPFTNIPILSIMLGRFIAALPLPNFTGWQIALGILLAYGAIALPVGFSSGFLRVLPILPLQKQISGILFVFLMPACLEELIFRAFLLPHPSERIAIEAWLVQAAISLVLFIVYHPLNAISFYRAGNPTFFHPIFLSLAGLLGASCTAAYALTGSIWTSVVIHWLVVAIWLFGLGGRAKLKNQVNQNRGNN
jgi:predicted Abi (CAAX) family protease